MIATRRAAALALALALALPACGNAAAAGDASANVITVTSSATVDVVPDKASIGVEIVSEGKTADEAQTANAKPTNAVIAKLKELGVDEKSIQTSYTDLSPVWSYEPVVAASTSDDEGEDEDGSRITGYEMRTRLEVSDLDVAQVSEVMQAVVKVGATGVDGPDYTTGSYDDAYAEALAAATEAARPKAEAIARAGGVSLGKVASVTEGYQDTRFRAMATNDTAAAEEALDMSVEPGQVTVEASVTVSYAIE